jgi:hypothetical protein
LSVPRYCNPDLVHHLVHSGRLDGQRGGEPVVHLGQRGPPDRAVGPDVGRPLVELVGGEPQPLRPPLVDTEVRRDLEDSTDVEDHRSYRHAPSLPLRQYRCHTQFLVRTDLTAAR